jgi:hypothetical protein
MTCIYFMRIGNDGPIKIGFTHGNPRKRMAELQAGCPWEINLIGTIPGTKLNEKWLHEKFSPFKIRNEWFEGAISSEVGVILDPSFSWPPIETLSLIDRAIKIAGSQIDLSNAIGISQPAISVARKNGMPLRLFARVQDFIASQSESAS